MLKLQSRPDGTYQWPRHPRQQYGDPEALSASCDSCRVIWCVKAALRFLERRKITQSELDWVYAKQALDRGEAEEAVIVAIVRFRRYDKHNPQYYAKHTVRIAAESLRSEMRPLEPAGPEPTR
jgi:hypothetical protein